MSSALDTIQFNADGLVPVVTVETGTQRLLMQAWANREAVQISITEERAVYWSRSRGQLWRKGESSGHVQVLKSIYLDCDSDCLCYEVEQLGGIACHTGRASCFYRRLEGEQWQEVAPVLKDSDAIYGSRNSSNG